MSEAAGAALVEVEGLSFRYGEGSFELSVPSFSLRRGERVACVGPSGSGKSTLLHLVAGILLARQGSVRFDGAEWRELSEAARRRRRIGGIGLVFQEFELLEHLDVRENVLLPYFVNRALRLDAPVRARLAELAERVGIADKLARKPRALSQGERQRVAICRALITAPALVLADEPTGNLDPETTGRVLDTLLEEVARGGAALLMVTHDHSLLGRFDRTMDLAATAELGR